MAARLPHTACDPAEPLPTRLGLHGEGPSSICYSRRPPLPSKLDPKLKPQQVPNHSSFSPTALTGASPTVSSMKGMEGLRSRRNCRILCIDGCYLTSTGHYWRTGNTKLSIEATALLGVASPIGWKTEASTQPLSGSGGSVAAVVRITVLDPCPCPRLGEGGGNRAISKHSLAPDNFLVPSTVKSLLRVYRQNDVIPMRVRKLSCFFPSYNWLLGRIVYFNLLLSKCS